MKRNTQFRQSVAGSGTRQYAGMGYQCACQLVFCLMLATAGNAQTIEQSRGADPLVSYASLTKYGPWDDRNYQLTAQDIALLSEEETASHDPIPAFFRVELRREFPNLPRRGPHQYPRAAVPLFNLRYGGLLVDGQLPAATIERAEIPVPVNGEIQLNDVLGANEVTVEINHANEQQVIAGANNSGVEMYRSDDGGISWSITGLLPNTCCDPTVGWSPDGQVAYAAALSGTLGVSVWRSFDAGQTWVDREQLTFSGSDKEFLHVDQSAVSPFQGNVYVTYHDGNVMQFARSVPDENGIAGTNFDIRSFDTAPIGIGSDITTTSNGDLYFFWAATSAQAIYLLKSTDGGTSFSNPTAVASTLGRYDFPIPAMETRRAWIYASADADRSGGPHDGSVYVAYTDTAQPENNSNPSANHTIIKVAYSRDGGQTWRTSIPHSQEDSNSVDRFNQWLHVDEQGAIHVVYYDTRHSPDRSGVDLYYTLSTDGAVTWNPPERVSSTTSQNLSDNQEWGDYNGLSVLAARALPTWTDNRDAPPDSKDVFAGDLTNIANEPGFTLIADPRQQSVCVPGSLTPIDLAIGSIQSFSYPVGLTFDQLPTGFSGTFSSNPVVPPARSSGEVTGSLQAVAGSYEFRVTGSAVNADPRSVSLTVDAYDQTPQEPRVRAPGPMAEDLALTPTFIWAGTDQAVTYTLEIDDEPTFESPVESLVIAGATRATLQTALEPESRYYWRLRGSNPCGEGAFSEVRSFTTTSQICSTPAATIPDGQSSGIDSPILISTGGPISDLDVSLDVSHTFVGDLIVSLTHTQSDTTIRLLDRPGVPASQQGCSGNDIEATMDDSGLAAIENACAATGKAIRGRFRPEEKLAAFDGTPLAGLWVLNVTDTVPQDIGVLNSWCLQPTAPAGIDSDGDGVDDTLDNCPADFNPAQENFDEDPLGDLCDPDDDNDGVADEDDAFPLDATESSDFDDDMIGDNADTDDDNDGQLDLDELACGSDPFDQSSLAPDADSDGVPDCMIMRSRFE